ncbi:hypothetical protein JTB14_001392 [Gonioctena quinquepunctata]|nr:hypothetical protein JTB14_001392 [Gonioctena quinquepunctata]
MLQHTAKSERPDKNENVSVLTTKKATADSASTEKRNGNSEGDPKTNHHIPQKQISAELLKIDTERSRKEMGTVQNNQPAANNSEVWIPASYRRQHRTNKKL